MSFLAIKVTVRICGLSIHFCFAHGKEDGLVQELFKNTSKELESVHGCTIYKLKELIFGSLLGDL